MAKISVIVPIYGVEKYLRECLDSIVNQTLKDIEILLIDDGGKDNCPAIIDEYAQKDSRIIPIHKPNGGYGHSCNVGLEKATGEYIAIIEPDDFIDLNMFEDLYDLAKKNNADVVKSSFYDFYDTEKYKAHKKKNWNDLYNIPKTSFKISECPYFLYFHPSIWSCIYRRDFLNQNDIRFIEAPGAGWTDNPFQVQTLCLAQKIVYTDEAYYHWRKINLKEAKDLKDITIPYKRSKEIHDWLQKNNINNENILACLYKREFAYMHLLNAASAGKNILQRAKENKNIISLMNEKILYTNKNIKKNEIKFYNSVKNSDLLNILKRDFIYYISFFINIIVELIYISILKIFKNKKMALWGASIFLELFLEKYKIKNTNIIGIIDKNSTRWGKKIGDYEIFSPEKLKELSPKFLLLTIIHRNTTIYGDIKQYLKENNINIKLLPNIMGLFYRD